MRDKDGKSLAADRGEREEEDGDGDGLEDILLGSILTTDDM